MDTERSITIVFSAGDEKESITLKGEKIGHAFDHENHVVRIFADSVTVIVKLELFLFIRQSN